MSKMKNENKIKKLTYFRLKIVTSKFFDVN